MRAARRIVLLGLTILLVSAAVTARIAAWLVDDTGLSGSGSALRQPGAAWGSMVPAAIGVAVGVWLLVARRRLGEWAGRKAWALTAAVFGIAALAVIGAFWYPSGSKATLVAFDGSGGVAWRTATPATELQGVRAQTATEVVVEGLRYHRCEFDRLSIALDRRTGVVRRTVKLPIYFRDIASAPTPPPKPKPSEFAFEQGHPSVRCSS